MRGRWIVDPATGELVPAHLYVRPSGPRSHLSCPQVITDTMEPVQSMLDGKMYDSKAALRATYRAAGVTEVGNDSSITDPKPFKKPRPKREDVRASVEKALSRAGFGA